LLDKYDFQIATLESENASIYKQRESEALERKKANKVPAKEILAAKTTCDQAPDPCLPPFLPP